ncbi:hypothetical protein LBMAG27_01970 [Bacteroidota bacterium]|nr:hypothetical protein LBMAG27_01970 [Bacteroidota bacterium]
MFSARYPEYNYPLYNNFLPSKKFSCKFTDAHILVEYEKENGKWFLKKLLHEYSYEFDKSVTGEKTFSITDAFEFYCDSVSHFISPALYDSFYVTADLPVRKYQYEKEQWQIALPSFYFFNDNEIYNDLEKAKSLDEQYEEEAK